MIILGAVYNIRDYDQRVVGAETNCFIRHINPLMFDVIDDETRGRCRRGLSCIKTSPYGEGLYTLTLSHKSLAGSCVINTRAILHEVFII